MVETMRVECSGDTAHIHEIRATFATELGMPMFNNEPVAIILFNMVSKFCNSTAPHFPIKKVLLLLWKTILVSDLTEMSNCVLLLLLLLVSYPSAGCFLGVNGLTEGAFYS